MIFHTPRTILIGDFAEMITYNDLSKVKRFNFWLPQFILNKAYHNLIYKWNQISNEKEIQKEINENKHKLKTLIHLRIYYPIMLKMLNITAKTGFKEAKEALFKAYKYVYHVEPKNEHDYARIMKDIDIKLLKFKQRYGQEQTKEGIDFEQLLVNIEVLLAPVSIRDKKLYTLPKYIEVASNKIKQNGSRD